MKFVRTYVLICLGLTLLSGCGEKLPIAPLTGSVLLDGKPYANGSLMFTPTAGGRPSVAATDENGKFKAVFNANSAGALIGQHMVTFEAAGKVEVDEFKPYAPPANNLKISPTEITVEAVGTEITFTLSKKK